MAIIVGQYIVTGNNKNKQDYAYGIKYPYAMTNNTFELAYDNLTQLKTNLKNLLSTKRGERINQPLFGSNLHQFIFEQQSEDLNNKIFNEIERTVAFWIPQVSISQIEVSSTPDMLERGELEIKITFQADYNNQLFDVNFKVRS
jgi:phage baseplate assembly protein W